MPDAETREPARLTSAALGVLGREHQHVALLADRIATFPDVPPSIAAQVRAAAEELREATDALGFILQRTHTTQESA